MQASSGLTDNALIQRYLDPGDALGEMLFGLIMVLSFTVGARLLLTEEQFDTTELVVGAVGCNIAWGVIDAVLFVLGSFFHRSRRARFYRALKNARDDTEALARIQDEFGFEDEPIAILPEDRARLHDAILNLSARAAPPRARLMRQDFWAALIVFLLVSATALPGVIPFFLLDDPNLALRVSNTVLILLLFLGGYRWGHYTDARPWQVGLTVMVLGIVMVLVAVALGG